MTSSERRATLRYQVKPETLIYFPGSESAAVQDLSLGGMYIEDKTSRFSEGTELELELRMSEESTGLRGVVTRVNPGQGFAVKFLEYSSNLKTRLENAFQREWDS